MKNINHTRSSISDDIRNILCSSANMRRAIPLILRLLMRSEERFSRNAETDLVCRLLLEKKNHVLTHHPRALQALHARHQLALSQTGLRAVQRASETEGS